MNAAADPGLPAAAFRDIEAPVPQAPGEGTPACRDGQEHR